MQKGDNLAGTVRTEGPGASWIPHGADDVSVPRVLAAAPRRRLAADHVLQWPPRDRRAFVSCHQKCGCRWLAPHLQDLSPNSETAGRRLAPVGRQHQITGVWRWEDGGGFDVWVGQWPAMILCYMALDDSMWLKSRISNIFFLKWAKIKRLVFVFFEAQVLTDE